ncbi:uncharacterized protein DUF4190 [Solirubrobacter pauli]|uniref:Uncharacterized protein DUF4190 n=1 Tax=Solirubrobacter pauli TaxID=166793 RepID=A0A660LFH8_9ACTN|nr:DUF4190 domain-containing protein [Solirubrobacter pauli]RKQ91471.1 uncharacterized protein DUF4190 [Solirubrobacter pauli]
MSGQGDDEQQQPPQWQQPQWQSQWQQPEQQPQWGQQPQQWGQQETPQWQQGFNQPQQTPGSATAALILGICSLVICPLICGPLAVVYGNKAKREIDNSGGRLTGRGMAQAGVVTGWIGVAFAVISILFFVVVLGVGISNS